MEIKEGDIGDYEQLGSEGAENMYCLVITAEPNKSTAFVLEMYLDFKIRNLRKGILIRNIPGFAKNIVVNCSCIHQVNRDFIDDYFGELPEKQFARVSNKIKNKLVPIAIHDLKLLHKEYPHNENE